MNWSSVRTIGFGILGAFVATVNVTAFGQVQPGDGPPISVTVTSAAKKLSAGPSLCWQTPPAARTMDDTIVIEPDKQFQKMLGFGGAFTDAACYMFNQLSAESRRSLFQQLFGADNLALNLDRVPMGSSDYATHVYSYDDSDTPDPELRKFNIDHDRKYILPMIREALKTNPNLFLFASPWSPPGWMKSNKSMLGGNMQRKYMPAYAQYFVKFIESYKTEGVPISAVTINNEVDTDQDGKMPACLWPQEYEVDFVRQNLGPAFKAAALPTQIWMIDHNYNLWGRALASLEEPDIQKYVSAIAWHGYVGDAARVSQVKSAFPNVDMYWTEGGPDYTDPNYTLDWTKWSRTFTTNIRNYCRGITVWNLALDESGKPNIGPFPCGGLVTINSKTKDISYSGQYYALAHFSKFVKRDAARVHSTCTAKEIDQIAFRNPDGKMVAVLTNSDGKARGVSIFSPSGMTHLEVEPNSVTTLVW